MSSKSFADFRAPSRIFSVPRGGLGAGKSSAPKSLESAGVGGCACVVNRHCKNSALGGGAPKQPLPQHGGGQAALQAENKEWKGAKYIHFDLNISVWISVQIG